MAEHNHASLMQPSFAHKTHCALLHTLEVPMRDKKALPCKLNPLAVRLTPSVAVPYHSNHRYVKRVS